MTNPDLTNAGKIRVATEASAEAEYHSSRTTFAKLLEDLNIERVDLMKIDVEGFELEVLKGCDFSSTFRPRNIFVEFNAPQSPEDDSNCQIYRLLTQHGYEAYTVLGDRLEEGVVPPEFNAVFRSRDQLASPRSSVSRL